MMPQMELLSGRNVLPRSKRQTSVNARTILLALATASLLPAQQPAAQPPVPDQPQDLKATSDNKDVSPKSPRWKGLTVKEKLRYDWVHLFDADNLVFAAVGASFDQLRDRPPQWGQGWGPLGERYASHVGSYIIQRSVMFPVQAIDHEDTRFFRSTRTSFKGRIGDAVLHTIWRHNDSGGMMPAYSEFLGDYSAAALSRMWWPAKYRTGSAIFFAGSDTILVDAGINVLHELKPDIKRWLRMSH